MLGARLRCSYHVLCKPSLAATVALALLDRPLSVGFTCRYTILHSREVVEVLREVRLTTGWTVVGVFAFGQVCFGLITLYHWHH